MLLFRTDQFCWIFFSLCLTVCLVTNLGGNIRHGLPAAAAVNCTHSTHLTGFPFCCWKEEFSLHIFDASGFVAGAVQSILVLSSLSIRPAFGLDYFGILRVVVVVVVVVVMTGQTCQKLYPLFCLLLSPLNPTTTFPPPSLLLLHLHSIDG